MVWARGTCILSFNLQQWNLLINFILSNPQPDTLYCKLQCIALPWEFLLISNIPMHVMRRSIRNINIFFSNNITKQNNRVHCTCRRKNMWWWWLQWHCTWQHASTVSTCMLLWIEPWKKNYMYCTLYILPAGTCGN